MDKMQEDFEAWHKSVVVGDPPHDKYNSGDYRNQHVQRYWIGWKASRESLVIDLPAPRQTLAGPSLYAQFKEAVEASGAQVAIKETP
ncbi:hypothetical protein BK660_21740 [Pseudomonas brassicacearum]|uniref:Uncharacterized protein n=1 Tax=Pseudomonas brassicacearum TaxID=930166 RepID=A0A423HXP1_9PSED|nr:hypothetical protein [Pseudomonas brassicacearum]RON17916.1 hypothetical protein BK660_21740 [Pseudomonas brassicacearum]